MLKLEQVQSIYDYNMKRNLLTYVEENELSYKIEEIDEYFKAKKEGNVHGMIDALCDLTVFACGVMFKNNMMPRDIDMHEMSHYNSIKHIIFGLESELRCIKVSLRMIHELGYNPTLCMDEVIMHIESREGEINKQTGKFEKYMTPEYVEKWYEPDYEKCKYKKESIYDR